MRQRGWLGLIVMCGCLAGCANKPPAANPTTTEPVGTAETLEQARTRFKAANPGAEIGAVIAVLPEHNLAAVGDIPAANFKVGDPVTFLDNNLDDLTIGSVVAIVNNNLQVQYETPTAGHRAPEVGDLAVRIVSAPGAPTGQPAAPPDTGNGTAASPAAPSADSGAGKPPEPSK
jgi:hypothetical protein